MRTVSSWLLVFVVFGLHQECVTQTNGHLAIPGTELWNIGVYKRHEVGDHHAKICEGVLLTPDIIISAAHCFHDKVSGKLSNASEFIVAERTADLQISSESNGRKSFVQRIDVPEEYSGLLGDYANDIALVRLLPPFFSVPPIHENWEAIFCNKQFDSLTKIYGWEDIQTMEYGQKVEASDYNTHGNCATKMSIYFRETLPKDKFCLNFLTRSSNRSDVGGRGLKVEGIRTWCLGGIISKIPNDDTTRDYNTYAVFTNVSYLADWIRAFMPSAGNGTTAQTGCTLPEKPRGGSFEIRSCSGECSNGPFPEGNVPSYKCNEGYILQGNNTRICGDKEWSQPPICVKLGKIIGEAELRVNVNQPATLSCLAEGDPLSNFTWAKIDESGNSKYLGNGTVIQKNSTDVVINLEFTNITRQDNGTYECSATDYNGTITGQTSLVVVEVPEVYINFTKSHGADSVYLNWTVYDGNEALTLYCIQQKKEDTNQWGNCSEKISVNKTSFVATGLEKNTSYQFRLTATNSIGTSEPDYSDSVTTQKHDEVTEFLTEVTVERTSETSITVFWTPPQGAIQDQFHYYQLLASYGNDIRKAINLPLNVTTYIFQDLTSGAKYKVELKACSMYTLQCVPSTTPENKGFDINVVIWSGSAAALIVFVVMAIWMIIHKRREVLWRRERRLSAFNAIMLGHGAPNLRVDNEYR